MSDPTYELPNNNLFGSIEQFDEDKKCLARMAVIRFIDNDIERAELFDALDIWPDYVQGS